MIEKEGETILETFEEVLQVFPDIKEDKNINRFRSSYIYRGLSDANYKLKTSLQRNCGDNQRNLEKCILRNFTKYATIIDNSHMIDSEWKQMIIGQHHGLPTRLLDWSYSALVALHFATSEDDLKKMGTHDCAIWAIDTNEINAMIPEEYWKILKKEEAYMFTTDMLKEKNLDDYDKEMGDKAFILLEPPSIDERIVNQYSFFSVTPTELTDFDGFLINHTLNSRKYIIRGGIRWQIRDMLDTLNLNERIMFPGYEGICKWLRRHYYDRE